MSVYKSLAEISSQFDVFLFDAYGVFWNGSDFYPNSREVMRSLVASGKTVVVVSNATLLHEDMVKSYERKGLHEGKDYSFMVSSGEVLHHDLLACNLCFSSCSQPKKYYVFGAPHGKMFLDTPYRQVEQLEEADFIYCGVPFLTKAEIEAFPQYKSCFWPVKADEKGNIIFWDTEVTDPLQPEIEKIAAFKKPILNANPDYLAQEGHPLIQKSAPCFVIRNGTTAELLHQRGCELLEYGKPHKNIYDYVFAKLQHYGIKTAKNRICMIGDTVRTDIRGAVDNGIVPVLCVQTGVTALEILKGNSVKKLCKKENIDIQKIVEISSVGGM